MTQPSKDVDKVARVRAEVDDVKLVMQGNIERVIERGEALESIEGRTENLVTEASRFQKQSTKLKRTMWYKNLKLMVILAIVIIMVLYFILAGVCGFGFEKCAPAPPAKNP